MRSINYLNNLITNVKTFYEIFNQQDTTTKAIFVNQIGYDSDKPKFATATNFKTGSIFYLKKASDNSIVYSGTVNKQKINFTNFTNNTDDEFYLQVDKKVSYAFKVKENLIFETSIPVAMLFMEMSRTDPVLSSATSTGIAWRDSHQFSFEVNSLVMLYMSNPSYYESLPYNVYRCSECEYEELQTQNEPNIIWLIKYAVTKYYKWATEKDIQLHAFIKGQIAYFLYLYPYIKQYVTEEFYNTIRDFTISIWSVETCNKSWYNETVTHNLFTTESVIGTVKGANPPGYSIVPNLMMYEVLKRDGLEGYQDYFDAAYNSCKWIIDSVDFNDPQTTKGQRMNEYITMTSLTYFYEMYTQECPSGLFDKIKQWANIMISRSNNIWDYRQYRTKGDISGSTETTWVNDYTGTGGLGNQPGNVLGFPAICYSIIRIIDDENIKQRLKEMAVAHFDHGYGRNPHSMHFSNKATSQFDGADNDWGKRMNGVGDLSWVTGVLDGSPKEASYPFDPSADLGYSEGWVAFNTAWNMSLAYLCAENNEINKIGIFN